ncbi:PREDICTED: tyrosine-protein phosphatase non-receptor type 7-like [Eufriesea mexicana]|uniref:tyrosine-protein phosphatase non-receptor type 7-like n=1 Tax=Eufriesea mexicana TaxID=516756 RepID=UPI00083C1C99|nr:PREDICTED: tyrosine-protein phosphatase non-receptor type 7-like [Eufriesea mexicana]
MAVYTSTQPLVSNRGTQLSFNRTVFVFLVYLFLTEGGTSTPLTNHYVNDANYYDISSNEDSSVPLEKFYLITGQRWHTDTVLPIPLLPSTEGMSTRSHRRIPQSITGLDDAGMDLQATQLSTRTRQEVLTAAYISWLNWQLSVFAAFCIIGSVILFTILVLLWLRKQMSREKNTEDGDRRGLVEEGAVGQPEKAIKPAKGSIEWIHQSTAKPSIQSVRSVTQATGLPEVMSVTTPERRPEPIRIKTKRLLERRGSSASLTIEVAPPLESPPHIVTPTRECTAEEFLLSAGNVLSRAQLKKVINDPTSLYKEFWEVPLNLPEKLDICGSGVKNRYCSVLPNPQSRVILPGSSDDPLSSYINANYIRGYDGKDARYIATQGPLAHTVGDFWKMVWAEKVPVVVMITKLHEAAKTKCEAYFPLDKDTRIQAGPFAVIVNSIDVREGYTIRDLELLYEGERRHVQHYWYDSWPDHAVPQAADTLVSLAAKVNSLSGPVVVHCSAGIGRTGCFIALTIGMTQLLRDGNVDVLGILCQMRYDRGGMVQTPEQYEFVHRALCLYEQTLDDGKSSSSGD